jgi:hypothetical protein
MGEKETAADRQSTAGSGGVTHEDDWSSQRKAAGGGGVKDPTPAEIAIGDPGVNDNLARASGDAGAAGLAIGDPGVNGPGVAAGDAGAQGLAIGDPGVNGPGIAVGEPGWNTPSGIAVSDEGVPGVKPNHPSSH